MEANNPCLVCNANQWENLSHSPTEVAITTDGHFIDQQINKGHCLNCGLVRRFPLEDSGKLQEFYQDQYDLYDRPAPANYDLKLYQAYASWIAKSLADIKPASCIEVGCGRGELMSLMHDHWPVCNFSGVEPNFNASGPGIKSDLNIINAMIGVDNIELPKADLVFSLNVIEHVPDPISFLKHLSKLTSDDGQVLILCPDGSIAHNDILFADHLWTYASAHIKLLCEKAGLRVVKSWQSTSEVPGETVQMHLAEKSRLKDTTHLFSELKQNSHSLLEKRISYYQNWQQLDQVLTERLEAYTNVSCFGARTWAHLVRLYAPTAWQKINSYVVDGVSGNEKSLPVHNYETFKKNQAEALLLGVKPSYHAMLRQRLADDEWDVITWEDIVST